MRVTTCDECGDRERKGFMIDGECRDCRGIDVCETIHSQRDRPKTYNDREAWDHAMQESRHHIIHNDRFQGDTNGNL